MDKPNVVTERFDFLLLHGCGAACGDRVLENSFGSVLTLFHVDIPRAGLCRLVLLLCGVEPAVGNLGYGKVPLLFGVEEHLDALAGNDLAAHDLLVDVVFGRYGAEIAEVGEYRVGNGAGRSVALDVYGERERFAHLHVGAVEVGAEAVVAHHAAEVRGLAFGGERFHHDVNRGGLGLGLDGFLPDALRMERHAAHLLVLFDNLRFAAFGVLELERRNLQVATLGGAKPCKLGACLHFAAAAFHGFKF